MRHLYNFKGFYYFRSRVPSDLQGFFQCTIIKQSLKTRDVKTASTSAKLIGNELSRIIKVMRSGILNKEQMNQLVQEFFDNNLRKREYSSLLRDDKRDDKYKKKRVKECDALLKQYNHHLDEERHVYDGILTEFLESHNIILEKTSYDFLKLRKDFIIALIKATEIEKARVQGHYSNWYDDFNEKLRNPILPNPIENDNTSDNKLLIDTAEEFFKEKRVAEKWRTKTEEGNRSMFNLFHEIVKVILNTDTVYLHQVDRSVCVEYSELLKKIPANMKKFYPNETVADILELSELTKSHPISIKTRIQHLVFLSTLLLWCEQREYISKNPARGLTPKDKRKKNTLKSIFTREDLSRLFKSPVYDGIDSSQPEKFFIPIIALYSGLRLEEICQLYTEDIREIDGIPCFDICEGHDKHIKTESGVRIIPIHPVIIKTGFLKYVEGIRKRGIIKLWENLQRKREKYSQDFSKWFSRYKQKHITDDNKKTFHSFRHAFTDNLKQNGIAEEVRTELLGQAHESEAAGRYAKEYKPSMLFDAIKKLDYGTDISQLIFPMKKGFQPFFIIMP